MNSKLFLKLSTTLNVPLVFEFLFASTHSSQMSNLVKVRTIKKANAIRIRINAIGRRIGVMRIKTKIEKMF